MTAALHTTFAKAGERYSVRAWPTHEDGTNKRIGEMTVEERARVITEAQERQRLARLENTEAPAVLHHKRLSHARMDNWSTGDWSAEAQRRTR